MTFRLAWPKWPQPLVATAVIGLAFGLAVHKLGVQSLDGDEAFSWDMAVKPLAAIAQGLDPGNPPGYFIILHVWIPLAGASEFSLRFLSVLFGVVAVSLLICSMRILLGPRPAIVAGLLAAVNPFLLFFSQQTRAYSLLLALSLLAVRLLLALCRPRAPRWLWLVYGLTLLASFFVHYYVLQLLPVLILAPPLLARGHPKLTLANLAAVCAPGAIFVAWFIPRMQTARTFLPLTAGTLTLDRLLTDYAIALHFGEAPYTTRRELATLPLPWLLVGAALIIAGLGLWRGAGSRRRRMFLAFLALTPVVIVAAFTFARHGDFDPRYAMVGLIGYLGLLAAGLSALPARLALLAGGCLVGGWLWASHFYFTDPSYQRQDFRAAAGAVAAEETRGDAVILVAGYLTPMWHYYSPNMAATETDETRAGPRLAQQLEAATSGADWIYLLNWFDPHAGIRSWLDGNKVFVNGQAFGEYVLYRYTAHPPIWNDRPPQTTPVTVHVAGGLSLAGYRETRLSNNRGIRLQLVWRRTAPEVRDYWEVAALLDGNGTVLDQNGQWPGLGMLHFNTWDGQGFLVSEHTLHSRAIDSASHVAVALFDPARGVLGQPVQLPLSPAG